jgi:hypothetical protein
LLALAEIACSGDDLASGGGTGGAPAGTGGASAIDAATGLPNVCEEIENDAPVAGIAVLDGTPPTPEGGELVAGTYHLTSYEFYQSCVFEVDARYTVRVDAESTTAGVWHAIIDTPGTQARYSFDYESDSSTLVVTPICDEHNPFTRAQTLSYTATGTEILAFDETENCGTMISRFEKQ